MLGLRRGEVLGLRWEDVDLNAGTLRITGALQRLNGQLERTATKTKSSKRALSLPAVLVRTLQTHRDRQDLERQGAEWKEHGLVFSTVVGTPIDPRNLNRQFRSILKKAGLPTTTRFHDLRHSAATFMLLIGVPLKVISKILGHTQIATTADVYAHILPELERDAADRMDELFGSSDNDQEMDESEDEQEAE
jgi:integrase